jgi:hypothetical protein
MKKLLFIIFIIPFLIEAQNIGKMAPEEDPMTFPENMWGIDLMFNDGGIGMGTFYRRNVSRTVDIFVDFSISEYTDNQEVEFIDYFGRKITPFKENRVFLMPINFGMHYRIFEDVIADNLRPYLNLGAGPAMVVTTPYEKEFFRSFAYAQSKFTVGGYVGLGANFGISKKDLVGINFRYYIVHFFDKGVESLVNTYQNNLGGFYLTLNFGIMY